MIVGMELLQLPLSLFHYIPNISNQFNIIAIFENNDSPWQKKKLLKQRIIHFVIQAEVFKALITLSPLCPTVELVMIWKRLLFAWKDEHMDFKKFAPSPVFLWQLSIEHKGANNSLVA